MKRQTLIAVCAVVLALLIAGNHAAAARLEIGGVSALKGARSSGDFQQAGGAVITAGEALGRALSQGVSEAVARQEQQEQMAAAARPEILVPAFMRHWNELTRASLAKGAASLAAVAATGSISGSVMILENGSPFPPTYEVTVVAFDVHGYYQRHQKVGLDGSYVITGLEPGDYYVMTVSDNYVDELYRDIAMPLGLRETWQQAELVKVNEGATTTGIDFELQIGALLMGMVFRSDGVQPIQGQPLTFSFTRPGSEVEVYSLEYTTDEGFFAIHVPLAGEYKMAVRADTFMTTWYPDKSRWADGTVITIPESGGEVSDLNFTLQPWPAGEQPGSITGSYRYSDPLINPLISFATVFVFDAEDSSMVTLSIGFAGAINIEGLRAGRYFVYVDDQLGNLIGGSNYLGQFYSAPGSGGQPTPVQVKAGQVTRGVNVVLQPGGVISGKISSAEGAELDGVWVMALDADLANLELGKMLGNLHIFIGLADSTGHYRLAGLPTGDYFLRTISDSLINQSALGILEISSGAHYGQVVDKWYGGEANLFAMNTAASVAVTAPGETAGIDFVLEKAKWIRGRIYDAVSSEPVRIYKLFALNDTSAVPFISFSALLDMTKPGINSKYIDPSGYYRIGPLPAGSYKVLAVAPLSGTSNYLSEMYDGVHNFELAQTIEVGSGDVTGKIISVEHGATIQGFVDLPQEGGGTVRAGAGQIVSFPVVAYDAITGQLASLDFVQFNGGFRIDHLLPGSYRLLALPFTAPWAATWYGGGDTFAEAGVSGTVTVTNGETANCNILLEKGSGSISGVARIDPDGTALSQLLIIAYEATGHPVGMALSGRATVEGVVTDSTGQYLIPNLRTGNYYVRTFSLSRALGLSDQLLGLVDTFGGGAGEADIFSLLLGGGLGSLGGLFDTDMTFYQDMWYDKVPATLEVNLNNLVLNLLAYGLPSSYDASLFPLFLPAPWAEKIPAGATAIAVTDGSLTSGIDFHLAEAELTQLVTGVEGDESAALPQNFVVHANYPNPFNPATTIAFDLPAAAQVRVEVFDARGRQVRLLQQGTLPAGNHRLQWDGRLSSGAMAASGLYFTRISSGGIQKTVKMVLMK